MRSAGEKTSGLKGGREGQRLGKGPVRPRNRGTEVRVTPEDVWGGAGKAQGPAACTLTTCLALCPACHLNPLPQSCWGRWNCDSYFAKNRASSEGKGMSQAAPRSLSSPTTAPTIQHLGVDDTGGVGSGPAQKRTKCWATPLSLGWQGCYAVRPSLHQMLAPRTPQGRLPPAQVRDPGHCPPPLPPRVGQGRPRP